ncbi:MAG: cytosolic protein [Heteroscytonema crispum UTEX LB 1556]
MGWGNLQRLKHSSNNSFKNLKIRKRDRPCTPLSPHLPTWENLQNTCSKGARDFISEQRADYDSPWKESLENYFTDFIAFFFPQVDAEIDWTRGYEFLDTELQQIVRDAELGRRLADKLVKVWRTNGDETWVLVHIEVQSQEESDFSERMFVYNYRLRDRYNRRVASLAVLSNERLSWRPDQFQSELWGCEISFRFPVVKLLDYRQQWQVLENTDNPFATVVMAHLKAQETRSDRESRKYWKLYLTRRLYERGYQRQDILNLFRFINWVMALPQELDASFWQEVQQYQRERQMP